MLIHLCLLPLLVVALPRPSANSFSSFCPPWTGSTHRKDCRDLPLACPCSQRILGVAPPSSSLWWLSATPRVKTWGPLDSLTSAEHRDFFPWDPGPTLPNRIFSSDLSVEALSINRRSPEQFNYFTILSYAAVDNCEARARRWLDPHHPLETHTTAVFAEPEALQDLYVSLSPSHSTEQWLFVLRRVHVPYSLSLCTDFPVFANSCSNTTELHLISEEFNQALSAQINTFIYFENSSLTNITLRAAEEDPPTEHVWAVALCQMSTIPPLHREILYGDASTPPPTLWTVDDLCFRDTCPTVIGRSATAPVLPLPNNWKIRTVPRPLPALSSLDLSRGPPRTHFAPSPRRNRRGRRIRRLLCALPTVLSVRLGQALSLLTKCLLATLVMFLAIHISGLFFGAGFSSDITGDGPTHSPTLDPKAGSDLPPEGTSPHQEQLAEIFGNGWPSDPSTSIGSTVISLLMPSIVSPLLWFLSSRPAWPEILQEDIALWLSLSDPSALRLRVSGQFQYTNTASDGACGLHVIKQAQLSLRSQEGWYRHDPSARLTYSSDLTAFVASLDRGEWPSLTALPRAEIRRKLIAWIKEFSSPTIAPTRVDSSDWFDTYMVRIFGAQWHLRLWSANPSQGLFFLSSGPEVSTARLSSVLELVEGGYPTQTQHFAFGSSHFCPFDPPRFTQAEWLTAWTDLLSQTRETLRTFLACGAPTQECLLPSSMGFAPWESPPDLVISPLRSLLLAEPVSPDQLLFLRQVPRMRSLPGPPLVYSESVLPPASLPASGQLSLALLWARPATAIPAAPGYLLALPKQPTSSAGTLSNREPSAPLPPATPASSPLECSSASASREVSILGRRSRSHSPLLSSSKRGRLPAKTPPSRPPSGSRSHALRPSAARKSSPAVTSASAVSHFFVPPLLIPLVPCPLRPICLLRVPLHTLDGTRPPRLNLNISRLTLPWAIRWPVAPSPTCRRK